MKIAITGANGMVGKLLVKKLREKKFEVMELTRANCDITNKEMTKKAIKGADVVVHCAAQLDEDAADIEEINVRGTENVLEAASAAGAKQFVYLSSIAVFGNTLGIKDEQTKPNPETKYEKTKWEAEKKVLEYQEVFPVTIFRPAIIVGKNYYWEKIIKIIGKDFPLIGDGSNKWQLVCVEDVVDAIVFSINNEDCYGEVFIVAEKEGMTLRELAEFIRSELGMKKPLKTVPFWLGSMVAFVNGFVKIIPLLNPAYLKRMARDRRYSTKKLQKTGFTPKLSGKEGLKKIIHS